jgi:hypothetical protein
VPASSRRWRSGCDAGLLSATDILWEISNGGDFAELGNVLQTQRVGFLGTVSGLLSQETVTLARAARHSCFVINALTGALIKRIDTGVPVSN